MKPFRFKPGDTVVVVDKAYENDSAYLQTFIVGGQYRAIVGGPAFHTNDKRYCFLESSCELVDPAPELPEWF